MIYLDYAATTPLAPEAFEAMRRWLTEQFANPASDHQPGRAARAAVETARAEVAALIGAQPDEIIWTSGATEANNLAIKGALEFRGLDGAHLVTSRTEHKCVLDTCRHLESQHAARGLRVSYLKPGADGRITAEQVLAALTPQTALVSLMWVNNELGTINEIERLAPELRARGVLFHVDAVQAAGKLAIDLATLPVDLLSLSAHKLYGPKGIGALFVRKRPRARLAPQLHGGGHEQGMRSGTLATHQCVGMGVACRLAREWLAADASRIAGLRDALWSQLQDLPAIHRNGSGDGAPHILNVSFEGVDGEALRALLPGLALSSGAACSSATREPSYVLRALGRSDALANASLRFSLGRGTLPAEIEQAAQQVRAAVGHLRALADGHADAAVAMAAVPVNAFGYPMPIWQGFLQARAMIQADPVQGQRWQGEASDRVTATRLSLRLVVVEGQVVMADGRVLGCPVLIAVADWLVRQARGRPLAALQGLRSRDLVQALEIPEDKLHCALMGEDALLSLRPA